MSDDTTPQDDAAMSPASAGSVSVEPVAWSIQWHGENRPDAHWTYEDKHAAGICLAGCGSKGVVVPLYRSPTLTDADLELLRECEKDYEEAACNMDWHGRHSEAGILLRRSIAIGDLLKRLK